MSIPAGRSLSAPIPSRASFYVVIAGLVKLSTYVPDGRDQVLALVERGDLFGEFAPAETSVPMRAAAFDHRVVVGTVHRPVFEDILRNAPEIAMCVIRVLARRLRAAEQEIQDLALRNIRGRLASLLVRLSEEYGEPHNRGIRLSLRLTHHDLASMVGATRETTTSVISRFRYEGLLAVEQRMLIIGFARSHTAGIIDPGYTLELSKPLLHRHSWSRSELPDVRPADLQTSLERSPDDESLLCRPSACRS